MDRAELYLILAVCAAAFIAFQFLYQQKKNRAVFLQKAKQEFGQIPDREYTYEELERISHYYKNYKERAGNSIDDITWNDLDMDQVFLMMNRTYSSIGEEYLYWILRTPLMEEKELKERERLVRYFDSHQEKRLKLQEMYKQIGRLKKTSISDYIFRLTDVERKGNLHHYLMLASVLISLLLVLTAPSFGILLFLAALGNSIYQYYKEKGQVEAYFSCFQQIAAMLSYVKDFEHLDDGSLKEYTDRLKRTKKELAGLEKGVNFLASNNMTGSLADIMMDYLRILTHIDLIKFNSMLRSFLEHKHEIEELIKVFGLVESMIAIASFRRSMAYYCLPEFTEDGKAAICMEDIYHPAISHPVPNSISETRGILITGSNASGKSTFLKTAAINAILAQTIHTVLGHVYRGSFFRILSSMALQDSLENKESYYIVEIKSLKRILDSAKDAVPILCFVDEVLRGTNTVERIAASAQILKSLSRDNVLCFAATHDIELTYMLEAFYSNYHFEEDVKENDILFSYQLHSGRAVTRNAIKLLRIIGYEESIISEAENSAAVFLEKGEWIC